MAVLDDYFKEMAKREKQRKVFIRARKDGEKFHYIGYVSKENPWDKTLINSWLFRFGRYKEVRYYNPKTKKCVGVWDLKKHNEYCVEHHYNDTVGNENIYFTEVKKEKKEKFNMKEPKEIKEENSSETLREFLDRINIGPGDDRGFVVHELFTNTEMQVSRRYLECEAWKYLLDKKIVDYYEVTNIWGVRTAKFILE